MRSAANLEPVLGASDITGNDQARLAVLLSAVVGLSALVAVFLQQSGFTGSDFLSFREAQRSGLSLGYLMRPVFDHVIPGHRFVNWAIYSVAPLDHRVAVVLSVLVFAATLLVLHRLLAELLRPGPAPLLLTVFFGVSAIQVGTGQWWAAGLSRLPAGLFALASILLHVRFRRTGRRAQLAGSVVMVGLALLFSEDGLLIPPLLLALCVLVLEPERPLRQGVEAAVAEWWVWVPYLVPMAIALVASTSQTSRLYTFQSLVNLAHYLGAAWLQVFCPAVIGQLVNAGPLSAAEVLIVILAQAVVLGIVAWTIRRRPSAWRSWLFFLLGFLATQVPVGLIRTDYFAPEFVAHQHRYYSVTIALFTIALGTAVLPVGPTLTRALGRPGVVFAAVALVVYSASSVWTSARLAHSFDGRPAARYLGNLEHDLHAAEDRPGGATLLDGPVPRFIVDPLFAPYNRLTTIVPLAGSQIGFSTTRRNLYRVTDRGTFQPVTFTPKAGGPALELAASPVFAVIPPESQSVEDGAVCIESGRPQSFVGLQLPQPLPAGEWYLRVAYRASKDGLGGVFFDRNGEFVEAADPALPILAGQHESVVLLSHEAFSRFTIAVPFQFRLCITDLTVGLVEPRDPQVVG